VHTTAGRLIGGSAAVIGLIVVLGLRVAAATSSANSLIFATVVDNCTISAAPLAFGSYDPVIANAAAALDGSGTIIVACTKGATATIGLSTGSNGSHGVGTTRALYGGSAYLSYEVFRDAGRSQLWSNAGAGLYDIGAAPSKSPRTFTVYGRISANQDVPAGSYTDTMTATVNF
jgi:spore coat protein U-like protein